MKSYVKLTVLVVILLAVIMICANLILNSDSSHDEDRFYRVEAIRLASLIEKGEEYNLDDFDSITNVEELTDGFATTNSDYLIKEINGKFYRLDYSYHSNSKKTVSLFNLCFGAAALFILALLLFIGGRIVYPLKKLSNYSFELAKGNLVSPLKEQHTKLYDRFFWGLDLLREKLENQRSAELALQKQNKTMILSLSHDIKTPLSIIELYSKALERGLYKDEAKQSEVMRNIHEKCEEIRTYIDDIVKTTGEDFLDLEVNNTEFYLSELINAVSQFYSDKLGMLKISFSIEQYDNCLILGDLDRAIEVMQNIIENAIKYGDGKLISIEFSTEDNCRLIHIRNSGCTLPDGELPHIFDCFWRGSNATAKNGNGLGLYICRILMRKMKGDIYAQIHNESMIVTAVLAKS